MIFHVRGGCVLLIHSSVGGPGYSVTLTNIFLSAEDVAGTAFAIGDKIAIEGDLGEEPRR